MEHRRLSEHPTRAELLDAYAVPDRSRPWLRMNFVMSADGAATVHGASGPLGGETDRGTLSVLRMLADAVVVGAGTVRAEGYGGLGLDEEARAWRRSRGLGPHPRLVIMTNRLGLSPEMSVFTRAETPPLIITNSEAPADRVEDLQRVADVVRLGKERVDLHAAVGFLDDHGFSQVLCEGGPHLFGALLRDDLVDELCVTLSPKLVAGPSMRIAVTEDELDRPLRLVHTIPDAEGFVLMRYEVERERARRSDG